MTVSLPPPRRFQNDGVDDAILLWDDDVKSAFRHVRCHPSVISAFAFRFGGQLCLPMGMVFGSNVSPGEFDIISRARATLATSLSEEMFAGEGPGFCFAIEKIETQAEGRARW